jgi:hypothetical protein
MIQPLMIIVYGENSQMECALAAIVQAVSVGILVPRDRVVVVDSCAGSVCGDPSIGATTSVAVQRQLMLKINKRGSGGRSKIGRYLGSDSY